MRFINLIIVFFLTLIVQSFIEGTIYQLYRYTYLEIKGTKLISNILGYSIYRFGITFIPYMILAIIAFNLININKNFSIFKLGIINIAVNSLIVGFIGFYLESILFDKKIFYCCLISGFLLLIITYKIKVKGFTSN